MAAFNRLNPQAPSYIPLSYIPLYCYNQTLFTSHFSFTPAPPPLSYFAVSKSPYPTPPPPPPPHNLFPPPPPPPPPPVFEPTPPARAVTEAVRIVPPRRRPRVVPPSGRSGLNGRSSSGDQRRGFRSSAAAAAAQNHHQREPNFGRRFGISSRNGERRGGMLKKHDVLPLTPCEEKITTVMIKNIPKQYNGELLLKFLDEHCWLENQKRNQLQNSSQEDDDTVSAFDFMYLPVDFRTGCSRGFAFVNFTEARAVGKFLQACNRKPWDLFQSPKIREIVCAKIQGKEAQVKHFEKSIFRCESDEFLPVSFSPARDGSGQIVEEIRIGKRIASTTSNP